MAGRIVFFICVVAFSGVASWTVDLPEVRKYFFEKNPKKDVQKSRYGENERFFDNINADSPLNSDQKTNHVYDFLGNQANDENDVYNSEKYAGEFGYQRYREKQVHSIVRDGSVYLEGLRAAIEQYGEQLRQCETNITKIPPTTTSKTTWLPENEKPVPVAPTESIDCERITRASEHVRRLAELALWATKELNDRAYNDKYDGPSAEEEEKELLLRLAWFLDRLALLTGFQPKPQHFVTEPPTTTSTTTRAPPTQAPSSQEIVDYLLKCIKRDSNEPAPDRCRYPLTLPDSVKKIFNATDAPPTTSTMINNQYPNDILYLLQHQHPPELLVPSETKHLAKRSIAEATENPLLYLMQYYAKHKMWEIDNPIPPPAANDDLFQIQNHNTDVTTLKTLKKRSLANKKASHLRRLPENPMQDISYYLKHKSGVRYVKDENQAQKIKQYLDKIRNSENLTSKKYMQKLEKSLHRSARSIEYPRKYQPRIPQDPLQDISYHIKNKPGTNVRPNIRQAALYRAGLDQIFRTGNMESIRRYGSNYRPDVPDPFMAAIARSLADV